jgi:hypothetical protein
LAGDLARSATGDKVDGASRRSGESYGSFFIWFDNRQLVGLVLGYWWRSPVWPRLVRP